MRELRPVYLPPDPASRTTYVAGDRVQCDLWFPPVDIPLGFGQVGRPPVLVMAAGYSRMLFATMIPSRQAADLIAGHWLLLSEHLKAVPRELVWDNESAVGSWRAGRPKLTEDFEAFRGVLGCGVRQCRPGDPEAKGIVERGNGYLETSFLPGRTFTSPADFNAQLGAWLPVANTAHRAPDRVHPTARWEADRAAMLTLPPVAPAIGWRHPDPAAAGPLRARGQQRLLGPPRRGRAHRGRRRRPGHGHGDLRRDGGRHPRPVLGAPPVDHRPGPPPGGPRAGRTVPRTDPHRRRPDDVEQRDLSVYDAAFGLSEDRSHDAPPRPPPQQTPATRYA